MDLALVGIAAISGLAAAVAMLALAAGSTAAVVLFLFSPLPLMLAGVGWGHRTAAIAAVLGAVLLGAVAGWAGARGYVLATGLPGWGLAFAALQGGAVSGHSAVAFAAATLMALFYQKPLPALLGFFVAFLVAQSRVEARIHTVFETLWGGVLGTLVAVGLYILVRPHVAP